MCLDQDARGVMFCLDYLRALIDMAAKASWPMWMPL